MSDDLTHYMQATSRLREQVAALTAEVERQKERGDLLRAEVHASWRERDEAVALLREPLGDPGSYQRQRWVERRDALLAAVAPQEES